jgi:hypothetical protein
VTYALAATERGLFPVILFSTTRRFGCFAAMLISTSFAGAARLSETHNVNIDTNKSILR